MSAKNRVRKMQAVLVQRGVRDVELTLTPGAYPHRRRASFGVRNAPIKKAPRGLFYWSLAGKSKQFREVFDSRHNEQLAV